MSDTPIYVARPSDLEALQGFWSQSISGDPKLVRLQAQFGGGRRALVGEVLRDIQTTQDDAILWRVNCLDQENGVQWLVRMYGSLVATLSRDTLRKGRAEMVLNAQLPAQTKRVQAWYQQFITGLKESKTDAETGQVQLRLPQDNPLIALVEVVAAIARKTPIFLELQNPYVTNSLALAMFVETLMAEARESKSKLMIVLFDEPESDVTKSLYPLPLLDFYNRGADHIEVQAIAPWTAVETQAFLDSKSLKSDAARIAEIATGRPGFIAELVEILEEKGQLADDLSAVTLASLVPNNVDTDELEIPDAPAEEGKRQHATADDASRVAYLAALMGQAFPSRLVADMGGFVPESIDDLIDAQDDLFAEVQFSKEMNTWIYRFQRGSWREGVIEANQGDEGTDLARRVGLFMERFLVPRGYGFIAKTARVYAENNAGARAANMRSVALSNDAPDAWGLCYDLSKYFDEVSWPDTLRKTLWMNLLDRMVNGGNVQVAEKVHTEATAWATEHEDEREFNAWLLFSGSRLDARRQDLFRARDRGNDALKMYQALENKGRVAEVYNHLAMVEVQDGNLNAAMEKVSEALKSAQVETQDGKTGFIPGILASSEHIRGLVNRRAGKLEEAAEHFKRANEVAGQTGQSALALDSGLSFGEALLAGRKVEEARDVLGKVVGIAQAIGNPQREHNATQLLSQAHGALKEFDQAIAAAGRTLQLSQQLKLQQSLPIDLYNLGFFHFAAGKPTEALVFLKQADQVAGTLGNHPIVKELAYFKGMAHMQAGEKDAAKLSLEKAVGLSEQHKDWNKLCSSLEHLGGLAEQSGDTSGAKAHLSKAVQLANAHDQLKDARKGLRKKLEALS